MHWRFGLLCACWVVMAQNVFAQGVEQPLSSQEAVALALRQNPLMTAARQRIEQSKGNLTSARALPNPALRVVPFGTVNDNPVIVNQTFDVFGKLGLRTKAARYSLQAAEAELRATELQVRYEATVAYVDLLAAQRVRQLNEEAVRLARTLHETTVQRLSAGDVPVVDTTRSQIELARAEQELVKAEGEVEVKKAALNTALGRDPATAIAVTGELSYEPHSAHCLQHCFRRLALYLSCFPRHSPSSLQQGTSAFTRSTSAPVARVVFFFWTAPMSHARGR